MSCEVTYEDLAALAAGDLDEPRRAEVEAHLGECPRCRRRVAALNRADAALAGLRPAAPAPAAIVAARRAVAELTRGGRDPEIMTLEEVAEFLRIAPADLGEIVEELPAFELAGQVRVRRARLIEWIAARERAYTRQTAESWAARMTFVDTGTEMP